MPPELMRLILAATQHAQTPQRLRETMASPFVQDTLIPWMGVNPQVRVDPAMPRGTLGQVRHNDRNTVYLNQGLATDGQRSGRTLEDVLTHEYSHVANRQSGHPLIRETGRAFMDTARAVGPERKVGATPVNGLFESGASGDELRAWTLEGAMQLIRSGVKDKNQIPPEMRYKYPGLDLAFDWLMAQAAKPQNDPFYRRYGRPLPTPEVRDAVRVRINRP